MFELIIFYAFGAMLLLSALMVISVRNPVNAALFLVLAFFSSSAVWLLLRAEFLAIVLVLVYVGAVMVLFLFVVMMLDINLARLRAGFIRFLPVGALVALVLVTSMVMVVGGDDLNRVRGSGLVELDPGYSNTAELGAALFGQYLYPFEVAGAILLVAIVAAIALTQRPKRETKSQNPDAQVAVRRQDRVRLVKMQSKRGD